VVVTIILVTVVLLVLMTRKSTFFSLKLRNMGWYKKYRRQEMKMDGFADVVQWPCDW